MTYTHLAQEKRCQIHKLNRQGIHLSQIASELERSTSTISRELRRNASCLKAKVYFAKPYCSWQRGRNANTNGLLRQFFPKRRSLLNVTQAQVEEAVYLLNHRPRKCLGYRTPHEVFYNLPVRPLTLHSVALCT
ncbi:hypothetical protein EXZ61_07080 [Rhodoferax aquaticus]|uniref:Transposase IS30-like HTH domain-containing protein n=1 Tax=Rhodoferax aquaticus TaxID=2527691 RepID=A0A515EMT5_9BURK|nr:hypothetical protein EXZ61_07080 [Rhodoferax aquaticus]